MVMKLKDLSIAVMLNVTFLLHYASDTHATDVEKAIKTLQPIALVDKGISESKYWIPVKANLAEPTKPTLAAEKMGFPLNFCVSVNFLIKSDGKTADLQIVKTKPDDVIKEVTVAHFSHMLRWQFKPAAENINRLPVISNRVFNFKAKHNDATPDCYTD